MKSTVKKMFIFGLFVWIVMAVLVYVISIGYAM